MLRRLRLVSLRVRTGPHLGSSSACLRELSDHVPGPRHREELVLLAPDQLDRHIDLRMQLGACTAAVC